MEVNKVNLHIKINKLKAEVYLLERALQSVYDELGETYVSETEEGVVISNVMKNIDKVLNEGFEYEY